MRVTTPCEWAKLLLPRASPAAPQVGRAYTLRAHSPERNEVDIEVVIHEGGPLSDWATAARVGDEIFLAGPRGGYTMDAASQWIVLAADASALPAMASILERLPSRITVFGFALLENPQDLELLPSTHRHRCKWTDGIDSLIEMVGSIELPPSAGEVWAAGEAGLVRMLRAHFVSDRKLPKERVHCSGYWKRGSQDHRDSTAG